MQYNIKSLTTHDQLAAFPDNTSKTNLLLKYIPIDYIYELTSINSWRWNTSIETKMYTLEDFIKNQDKMLTTPVSYSPTVLYSQLFDLNYIGKCSFFIKLKYLIREDDDILFCPTILKESLPYWVICQMYNIDFPKDKVKIYVSTKLKGKGRRYNRLRKEFEKLNLSEFVVEWRDNINELIFKTTNIKFTNLEQKKSLIEEIKTEALKQMK